MKDIVFVKYGGSIITNKGKAMSVSSNTIHLLNEQIQYLLAGDASFTFVIGNGGGSFGHYFANKYQLSPISAEPKKIFGVCKGKNGNNYLNQIVVEDLLNRKISACSVRISTPYMMNNENKSWDEVLLCLDNNIIPVIYGDFVVLTNMKYNIISTEQAFNDLANYIYKYRRNEYKLKKIVFCTNTNGVLDANGKNISNITPNFIDDSIFWNCPKGYDVTGGMIEKVKKALQLSNYAPVQIINGKVENNLVKAINGENIGTIISS